MHLIERENKPKIYLVQVPAARGSVIPEMASINDDFPALWEPMTAICGRSMSVWTLVRGMSALHDESHSCLQSYPVLCKRFTKSNMRRLPWAKRGSDSPTPAFVSPSCEEGKEGEGVVEGKL